LIAKKIEGQRIYSDAKTSILVRVPMVKPMP